MHSTFKKIANFIKKAAITTVALSISLSTANAVPKGTYADKYAAIVIDANTGKTLFQASANARRYPASLTKMMTLYMLFEAIQSGQVSPNTPIPISSYAASRPPTKIGFKAGQTIPAEAAAKALITKSANDVATAIGEYLGGSEPRFAQMMTAKARRLGMMNTNFANASGLPDTKNYSTARDLAILSLSLRAHYPKQYEWFKTTSFTFRGQTINGHNRLVKNMEGVDGIKTGYTQMSGFNLASSMRLDGRSIVAVVLGGRSSGLRDAHMTELLRRYLPQASHGKTSTPLVAASQYDVPAANTAPIPVAKANIPENHQDNAQTLTALTSNTPQTDAVAAVNEAVVVKVARNTTQDDVDPIVTASAPANTRATAASAGWMIQIGSLPNQKQADDMLLKASNTARHTVSSAKPTTEVFKKGKRNYYRARFVGFQSKKSANDACLALKKANFNCYALSQ